MNILFASSLVLFFSAMMSIKGGWLGKFLPIDKWSGRHWFFDFILEGATLSAFIIMAVFAPFIGWTAAALGAAWWLGVRPSVGEEAGALGGWGEYVETTDFGREYGIKKAIQRGAWFGVPMTLVTGFTGWIIAGLMFVPVYFIGIKARKATTGANGWDWAEPVFGVFFGIAAYYYLIGVQ